MRRNTFISIALGIVLGVAMFFVFVQDCTTPAYAATPISGAYTAKAGTGGVTAKRLVKLEAAGTIITATGVGDSVVGVCEITATAGNQSRYAPVGTRATVTSGEGITIGDLLTAGAAGKAFVLDVDDASTQRTCAVALTAAAGADADVDVLLVAGTAEQRLALGGNVTIGDGKSFTVGSATGGPPSGEVEIFSATAAKGSLKLKQPDDANNKITTIQSNNAAANATITLPNATATVATTALTETLTNKTIDGDDNTVQDLGVAVPKVMTAGGDGTVGLSFIVEFVPAAAGNLDYTVPTGKKLRVIDAYGWKTVGAGAHADDELTLSNNGANNIFDIEELNAVGDKARFAFDNLDDAQSDVTAGNKLRLVANENAAGGCDARVYVVCVWVTP